MTDSIVEKGLSKRALLFLTIVSTSLVVITNFHDIWRIVSPNNLDATAVCSPYPQHPRQLGQYEKPSAINRGIFEYGAVLTITLSNSTNESFERIVIECQERWEDALWIRETSPYDTGVVRGVNHIDIAEMFPGDSINVYLWVHHEYPHWILSKSLSIRHAKGAVSPTYLESSYWLLGFLADHLILSILTALAFLLIFAGYFYDFGRKVEASSKESGSELDSESAEDGEEGPGDEEVTGKQ